MRATIEAAGAQLRYLPPYSPDLNPIEQMFAKLKALMRKAAARTVEALWTAIGNLVQTFQPGECRNYLRHSGYVRCLKSALAAEPEEVQRSSRVTSR